MTMTQLQRNVFDAIDQMPFKNLYEIAVKINKHLKDGDDDAAADKEENLEMCRALAQAAQEVLAPQSELSPHEKDGTF